jgi:hypothetical protein
VTPEYIRQLADLGYRDIPPATIVRMKMFGVTPAYVRNANDRANAKLSPEQLIKRRTTGFAPYNYSDRWPRESRRNERRNDRDD